MNVPELLPGNVVVVSGVGPGLGREIAVRSAMAGADVVLAARTAPYLDKVAAEIEALGRRALAVPTDITDPAAAQALAEATLSEFGRVDTLVNNAFAVPRNVELHEVDVDELRLGMETDVFAALRLSQLFTEGLRDSHGSIVMVNSSVLRHSKPACGNYKMAKSALLALAQSLSTELGPLGIRVNSVAPGPIWIDTVKEFVGAMAAARGLSLQEGYDELAADTDRRRIQEPDEVADAVIFLASELARAITGHCLDVNGGEFHH